MSLVIRSCLCFYTVLLFTSCTTVDPAVNLDGYRRISLQQKLHKAKLALANNNQHLALYWYRVAQSIVPDNEMIQQQTQQLQYSLQLQATQQFNKGEVVKRKGRYAQAKQHFLRALALQPEHQQALASLKTLDLTIMLTRRGSPSFFKNDKPTKQKIAPVAPWHKQQSKLFQQAVDALQGSKLLSSASLTQRAIRLGTLSLAGKKQVIKIYWGISGVYLNQHNVDLAYQYYRKGKEVHKTMSSGLAVSMDGVRTLLSAKLSAQLCQRGREAFPHQINHALYYWEACAYVDQNYRDIDRLLSMARRYKDRLDNLGRGL